MIKEIFGQQFGIYDLDVPDELNKKLVNLAYNINAESQFLSPAYSNRNPRQSGYSENEHSYIGAHLGLLNRVHLFSSFPKEFIIDYVDPIIKNYIDEIDQIECSFPDLIPYVDRCWFTLMQPNDAIGVHSHEDCGALSIAYYPDDMTDKGKFQIHSFNIDKKIHSYDPKFRNETIETKKSRLIIFPSHVHHGTIENLANVPRISYSMDVQFLGVETFIPPVELVEQLHTSFRKQLDFIGEA